MELYFCFIAYSLLIQGAVSSNPEIFTYLEDGSLEPRNTAINLGRERHHCVSNILKCSDGFSIKLRLTPQPMNPPVRHTYYISNGGQSLHSEGYYVRRNFGKDFEVGVAYSDLLWTVNFFLEDGISSIIGFTWENKTGLAVYIDGILVNANTSAGIRVFTNPMVDPFQDLFIGKSNSGVQMSDVAVIVSNITHKSASVRNESDMIKFTGAYDNMYYEGCASNAPTVGNQANARSDVEPAISDAFNCRKYCALNGRTYAFLKQNIGCECYTKSEYQDFAVELQVTQQCQNQWYIYRSGGMVFDPYFPIQLRIAISLPTNKEYTRPNETVTFTFTNKATEVVTYYVDYDDGMKKITRDEKISYAWNSVGLYNISVTAITRLSNETKYILMRIEWHDEGSPPEVVSLKTDNNNTLSKEVITYITGISKDVKNCTLNYGDGNFKEYKDEMDLIFNRVERHRYDDIGFYLASFKCENQFGKTKASETIVAIHPFVEHTYYQMFKDISIPLIGIADEANYKNLIVRVDGKDVSFIRQGNNITISSSVILFSGDHVVGLIGNGKTIFTKIFSVQKLISDVSINADVIHTQINQSLDFVFKVDKGDFLHIHIEYGDNQEEYLFAPAIDFPVAISKTYSYADLGKFYVMMTVANDVNSQKVQQIVSIERPVQNVTIEAINTTVIGESTIFTLEVDMELTPAMPVQVAFQYGDGNTETVILGKQQTSPTLLVHHYTYNTYGIYKVMAAVGNNISSVVVSTVLQVGEHITFVDVYTDKDRVLEDENITFTVHCPRGVPIQLEIDTGDGNILTVHRPLLPNQYVDGIIPPSTTTTRQPAVVDNGSGMVDGSGDNEGTDTQGVLARRKREIQSENIDTSGDVPYDQNEEIMPSTTVKPPNEDFTVVYAYPKSGKYIVKVKVSNKFNFAVTSLCPEIVVVPKESSEPNCNNFDVSITNTSSENLPLVKTRSEEINLLSETNIDCSTNIQGTVVTRYTWSTEWKTNTQEWRPELEVCETEEVQSSLVIDPNTLWYGTYRLKVKAALRVESSTGNERKKRTANDLIVQLPDTSIPSLKETESGYTYLQIIPTPLVAKIENNEEKRDATFWEIVDLNMAPSHDPDVTHSNKSGMNFHVFCYLKVDEPYMEDKTLEEMITASIKLANNSFNTAAVYETAACFEKYDKIWVVGYEILFPGDHGSMNDSLVFDMFVTKDTRVARAKAEIKIWSTNVSMDNALDAIDALLASGDTSAALMVIDMATDALNVGGDSNDTDAKNARAAMRGKLINVMGNVAEAVGNFDQLDKTAGALNKITVVQDEVTDDGRKKAAGALGSAASKADDLATDANLGAVTDMAQSMVGAAGNVLPFAEDEAPPTEEPVIVTTVQPEDLQPTAIPSLEEPSEPVEVIIPCCEREAGLCAWIEPPCIVIEEHERKSEVWDNVMCDSVHPDELTIIRDRYDKSKLAMKLNKFDQKKQTTTGGWNACLKIGNVIGKKQDTAGAETSIDTPKMKMKVASLDSGSGSSLGAFNVPPDVMGGLGGGSGATVLDTPNPFTYSDSASSVKGKVMTMAFKNPDGSPMKIANTTEPFNIWMPGKPELIPPPRNFTFLSSPDGATMNYHTVNITTNDTGLHLIIRPESIHDVYYIYVKYQAFPNETYYDWKGELPNKDKFDTNDTWKLEQLYYTVFPDTNSTRYNGTYRIGIILKETRLNLDQLSQANNFTYSMQVFLSGCRFWDNNKDTWSSEGCGIGNLTTIKETQCLCNHLTSFGGDFVVPPNTIDFNTVFNPEKFLESIPVFVTVISVIILYIGVLVWARKEDKKDLIKWGASPLEDNLPTDTYHYQMTVHTGVKKNATTTSSVSFILSGDECDSGVRRLYDGNRKEFPSGSIYNYILSVEQSLGPLTYLRIWHDNSGKGKTKSWHLNQIMMTDIQTGDKYFFLCGRWMAVEEDDGQVERILPVAGLNDLAAFKHLFASSVRKKLSNDHMWFSILSRPTKSTFTRVQRVSCCVALLFLTMITNCMFFKTEEKAENVKSLTIGPVTFTLHQLFISIVSTGIVFPPSLAIVTIFRKAKQKNNSIMQLNQSRSKKFKWRTINPGSSLWRNVEKSKLDKFKEAIRNITSFHQKTKYEADGSQVTLQSTTNTNKKKKKKGFMLPYWTNYIAWILVFFSIVASGFFTILYSMEWGREKSIEWLTTFLLSFFQSVIVVQPIKVLLLAAFISCILRKPEIDEEEEQAFDEAHIGDTATARRKVDLTASQQNLQELLKRRQLKASDLPPPDTEALEKAREYRLKELAMQSIIKECIVYFVFIIVLFFLSYQTRDPDCYIFANNIKNQFWSPKFHAISRPDTFWTWLNGYFLPTLYSGPHDNGQPLTWQESLQIDDRITIRVGVPRLRQLRIKPESCKVQPIMSSLVNHCRNGYNWNDDDTKDYLPGWKKRQRGWVNRTAKAYGDKYCTLVGGDLARLNSKKSSPWMYRNSLELKNAPYAGQLTMYKGGGYSAAFRRTREKTEKLLSILEKDEWVDVHTRAVFTEFTLYNANVNLFASVIMLVEWMATGAAITRGEVKVFRLYSYVGGFGSIVMIMEAIFLCFILYFFIHMVHMIRKQKKQYFKDFWNMLEVATLILSIISVGMYGAKKIFGHIAVKALKDSGSGEYVNFVTISIWDETFVLVLALVVFTSTLKFIKMLKFNKRMGMLGDTLKLAAKDLKPFMLMFFVYFFSFCMTAYVLFGKDLPSYGSFVGTMEALFAFSLGDFDFDAMQGVDQILGPAFFFMYVVIVYIGLMGMFLTIIDLSFAQVKANADLQSNDHEIVDFMLKKFKGMFGMS